MAMTEVVTTEQPTFNISISRKLFSEPMLQRYNCVLEALVSDTEAGISAGDIVRADFTATDISEGLYIVQSKDNFGWWMGYRFFNRAPDLKVRVDGSYYKVNLGDYTVIAKVLGVYRKQ